jgi:hypothetical protein
MNDTYTRGNMSERQHLIALVDRLPDEKLNYPLEAGWTVAGVLAHLAFWDQRALILLTKWQQEGIGSSAIDVDVVNEATRLLCIALPPRVAAQLAIATAEAIDQAIDQIDPAMIAEIETNGQTVRLNRADHRQEHLTQIEQALKIME